MSDFNDFSKKVTEDKRALISNAANEAKSNEENITQKQGPNENKNSNEQPKGEVEKQSQQNDVKNLSGNNLLNK